MAKSRSISWVFIGILVFSFFIQINLNGEIQTNQHDEPNNFFSQNPIPSKDDEGENGDDGDEGEQVFEREGFELNNLGEIEITHMYFYEEPDENNFSPSNSEVITYVHHGTNFEGTVYNASADRALEKTNPRSSNVTVQISESIIWTYNESATDYIVGYEPLLQTAFLQDIFLNGTKLISSDYINNYTYVGELQVFSFYYDFEEVFNENHAGKFNLTYVYNIAVPITQWYCLSPGPNQFITETNQTLTQNFIYNVTLGEEPTSFNSTLARFKIYLPDYQYLFEPALDKYNNDTLALGVDYNLDNNILTFTNATDLNQTISLDLTFKANFTIELLEVVDGLWSEDRLVENLNIRERDYKITITEGPPNLMITYFGINDTNIYFNHLINGANSGSSALGRTVYIENMNKSTGFEYHDDEMDEIDENYTVPEYVDGITFLHIPSDTIIEPYYLSKDEVDIITIRYEAINNLTLKIMDKINTPLEGINVKLFLGNQLYGTKINNFTTIPYPILSSDPNGEIIFHSVPMANFTIEIYGKNGNLIENATVSSLNDVNYVVTSISHYPITIFVFSGLSVACILVGFVIFKKNS